MRYQGFPRLPAEWTKGSSIAGPWRKPTKLVAARARARGPSSALRALCVLGAAKAGLASPRELVWSGLVVSPWLRPGILFPEVRRGPPSAAVSGLYDQVGVGLGENSGVVQ